MTPHGTQLQWNWTPLPALVFPVLHTCSCHSISGEFLLPSLHTAILISSSFKSWSNLTSCINPSLPITPQRPLSTLKPHGTSAELIWPARVGIGHSGRLSSLWTLLLFWRKQSLPPTLEGQDVCILSEPPFQLRQGHVTEAEPIRFTHHTSKVKASGVRKQSPCGPQAVQGDTWETAVFSSQVSGGSGRVFTNLAPWHDLGHCSWLMLSKPDSPALREVWA